MKLPKEVLKHNSNEDADEVAYFVLNQRRSLSKIWRNKFSREGDMSNGTTNVQRLVAAGIITDANLTDAAKNQLNGAALSDAEIDQLKSIQKKLGLVPLDPAKPGSPGIMQL